MEPTETTVAAVREVGTDAVAIDVETPAGFEAEPGQFVKLSTTIDGETEGRFYTISSPHVAGTFEFTVEYDPEAGGTFSEYLLDIEAGDTVEITGPFGDDHYAGESRVVVLAGGPGVGPAVAIAERAIADGNEAAVVYRDDDPIHEPRLATLAGTTAEVFVLSETDSLIDAVASVHTGDAGEQVFVYGFADFLEAAADAVAAAGGDPAASKAENFG